MRPYAVRTEIESNMSYDLFFQSRTGASDNDVLAYFRNSSGEKAREGDVLRNPAYAAFLRRLAAEGPAALYEGETARLLLHRTVQQQEERYEEEKDEQCDGDVKPGAL